MLQMCLALGITFNGNMNNVCLIKGSVSVGILHAHMEPHAVITYCPFRFYYFSDANLDTNLIFQRVTFRLAIAISAVVCSKIGCSDACTLSSWIASQNWTKCLILIICFNWGIHEQWIMTTAYFLKGQQISKQNCHAKTSPKKQTNKLVFLSWKVATY